MKTSRLVPVLLAFLMLPLGAQVPSGLNLPTPDLSGSATPPTPPSRARDIMPLQLNHKPNPTNPPAEIAGPINAFFKSLKEGNYASAYETYLSGTRLGAQKEKMSAMISRTEAGFGIYGKMNDYEIYDNYSVGSNVLVLTYLARHDVQPLRWRFIYYRPENSWHLINLGFDDFLLDMLD